MVTNSHSLVIFFFPPLLKQTEERNGECFYLYFCFAKNTEKRLSQRKIRLRIKHIIATGLKKVVPWGLLWRNQYFPKCAPWGVKRYMKKCSVVKKVWEMLRLAKSDRFLYWRALHTSAASPGWGKGVAGSGPQISAQSPLLGWTITQVQFSLKTLGNAYLTLVCYTLKFVYINNF